MTDLLFGTDVNGGLVFPRKARLKSAEHINLMLTWMRNVDAALEREIATNWIHNVASTDAADTLYDCAYDATLGLWVIAGGNAGAPIARSSADGTNWIAPAALVAGTNLGLRAAAASGAGVFVVSGEIAAPNTDMYYSSTDGTNWTSRASNYNDGTDGVCLCWTGGTTAKFVSGLSASGRIETAPAAGTPWTIRATPAACAGFSWAECASNTAGRTVLVPGGAADAFVAYSDDGVTWTSAAIAVPGVNGYQGIAYAPETDYWLAVSNSVIQQSDDGAVWATGTATLPAGCTAVNGLASSGNLFVLAYTTAVDYRIGVSADNGATWTQVARIATAAGGRMRFGKRGTYGGQLLLDSGNDTDASLAVWR